MELLDRLTDPVASLGRAAIARPLAAREIGIAAAVLLTFGTLYCAIYCRIAFYPMHSGGMPLWLSAWWATTALLPWFLAFEAVKRIALRVRGTLQLSLACVAVAAATGAMAIVAYRIADIDIMGMHASHWPMLIAAQLQPTVLFMVLVAVWGANRSRPAAGEASSHLDPLPPLSAVDWIRAAGNYVELKCGDRVVMRRMTMRSAEAAARPADFVRIHRSIMVRRPLIRGFVGRARSQLLLTTGETMPVGDSYRPALERLLAPEHRSAVRVPA